MTDEGDEDRRPKLLELALELAPVGMIAVDDVGRIVLANRETERLFGYTREQLLGQPVEMLVPDQARSAHPGWRDHYMREPRARPMGKGRDLFGQRADGSRMPVEIGLNPVQTPDGRFFVASIVDITTRSRIEGQLRRVQKQEALGTLVSGIAHDFNNILLAITGHVELLQNANVSEAQRQEDLASILQATERGRELVQRLLSTGRQEDLERKTVAPVAVVREAVALVRASVPSNIKVREQLNANTPCVQSQEGLIHQVVLNLATNATHAMGRGGELGVHLGPRLVENEDSRVPPGLYVSLRVTDEGDGMTDEVLQRVTEPFFTTKPQGEGTGLGLAMVQGIVRSHGGLLEIRSEAGRGTQVEVLLPAHEPAASAKTQDDSGKKRILLVEDERVLNRMLERHLRNFGYEVSAHLSSEHALESFCAQPACFDLLITDNSMPKMTGMELAREVHALQPELPILLISGLPPSTDELSAHGVRRAIPKPCPMATLESALEELLHDAGD